MSANKFFIIEKSKCAKCEGKGNYIGYVGYYPKPFKQEKVGCEKCNGNGYIERLVPLINALKQITNEEATK